MSGNKAKQTIQEARIDSVFVALEHLAVTWNAVDGLHYDGKHPWTEWTTCSRHFAIAATVIKNIGKITLNILPNMRHSPSSSEQQKWSRNLGIIFFLISFFHFFIRESYIFFFIREKIASTRHADKRSLERTWMSEWARVREWVRPWMRVWTSHHEGQLKSHRLLQILKKCTSLCNILPWTICSRLRLTPTFNLAEPVPRLFRCSWPHQLCVPSTFPFTLYSRAIPFLSLQILTKTAFQIITLVLLSSLIYFHTLLNIFLKNSSVFYFFFRSHENKTLVLLFETRNSHKTSRSKRRISQKH